VKKILLIELSATLRHAAKKLMANSGHTVTEVVNFAEGLDKLSADGAVSCYDAVLLGWPVRTDDDADELMSLLSEVQFKKVAVIVLAHEADSTRLAWVTERGNTALVLWGAYTEINDAIASLTHEIPVPTESDPLRFENEPSIRVLFVDDSPTVRVNYRRLLTKNGYEADTASCVEEGMEKALENQYDIAIIDYYMPDGTGDTLCRMLRDEPKTSSMTTSIITGTYSDKAIISSLAAGAIECMFKNEPKELFLARLRSMSRSLRAFRNIKNDHKNLQCILKSVGDGVYGVDREGMVTFMNPAAKDILGIDKSDDIIGKSAYHLFHHVGPDGKPINPDQCQLRKAYKIGDQLRSWPTYFSNKIQKMIPVECTVFPLWLEEDLKGSVVAFRDVTERKLLLEELKWQATHDSLTKLPNRNFFETQLLQEVKRLKRSDEKSALLYIDLDRFKYLNDTAGHRAGDQLLLAVGKQILMRLRDADTLARIGGDEFAIIMRNIDPEHSYEAADTFRDMLANYRFTFAGKAYNINASIGVAHINVDTRSAGEVLANADIACYIAKGKGRNNTHVFESENDQKAAMDIELGWSSRLHDALNQDHFVLCYQPIVPLKNLDINDLPNDPGLLWEKMLNNPAITTRHYEVLLRLPDSRGQLISPNAFLPTAERFNMMVDIDRWVIDAAIKELAVQQNNGLDVSFSINLSGHSLEVEELGEYIENVRDKYGVDRSTILFEITETSAIANIEAADRLISGLRELGYRFALDDFGSGFCSFSHLKHLPIDSIKIDGMFVQGMLHDSVDCAIVSSIIQVAHSIGKTTVAEFVENPEVLRQLFKMGVDYIQGYYVSQPQQIVNVNFPLQNRAESG
jgi:diguanylate cyclase (GGDEF)-like protein/PAS domain S-box-containing protein